VAGPTVPHRIVADLGVDETSDHRDETVDVALASNAGGVQQVDGAAPQPEFAFEHLPARKPLVAFAGLVPEQANNPIVITQVASKQRIRRFNFASTQQLV
jgi:hypothetical protein